MSATEHIIAQCAIEFQANSDDCNKFLKAVSAAFFEPDLFTGPSMDADAIVAELASSADWTNLGKSHADAIAKAKDNKFVVAGMTSKELGATHGHVAVVVGDDGQMSGKVTVPICYAGSLNASARVQRKRVSETFGATVARESRISYFAKAPQTLPAAEAVSRLVDCLRGIVMSETPVIAAMSRTSKKARKRQAKKNQPGKKK